jgi:hypothetical protein
VRRSKSLRNLTNVAKTRRAERDSGPRKRRNSTGTIYLGTFIVIITIIVIIIIIIIIIIVGIWSEEEEE